MRRGFLGRDERFAWDGSLVAVNERKSPGIPAVTPSMTTRQAQGGQTLTNPEMGLAGFLELCQVIEHLRTLFMRELVFMENLGKVVVRMGG